MPVSVAQSQRISKDTFAFLKELAANNDRNWFNQNKTRYEESKLNVEQFVAALLAEFLKKDPLLRDLDPKKTLLRIYRDVRFSKDKLPYKSHFAAGFSANGRKANEPGYYIAIGQDERYNGTKDSAFFAAGYWMPSPEDLKAIRQEIDYEFASLQHILEAADFKAAFSELSPEEKLKKFPPGFPSDQPHSELFKYRSFTVICPLTEKELTSGEGFKKLVSYMHTAYPFIEFLRKALE